MQKQRNSKRQRWLTVYRFATPILLLAVLTISVVTFVTRDQQVVITSSQADKVAQTASFIESSGFNDPIYLGITEGGEGEYPTFRATAIGGEPIDLWIRTTRNGGLEIQPAFMQHVKSADELAHLASQAVRMWEDMSPDIQPRTDGTWGEYERREYQFELLSPYDPDDSYWDIPVDETSGWPRN